MDRHVVGPPKLQLQLEFNVNNCLQLHLFICTLPEWSRWWRGTPQPSTYAGLSVAGFWLFVVHVSMRAIGFALIRISCMHGTWARLLFYFILFYLPFLSLYYDYHVLFNNWCANWQLSGSFTTLHTWRAITPQTAAVQQAEGGRRGGREPIH